MAIHSSLVNGALLFAAVTVQVQALWPAPASLTNGTSYTRLSSSFKITPSTDLPKDVLAYISTTETNIKADDLAPLIVGRNEDEKDKILGSKTLEGLNVGIGESSDEEERALMDRGESQIKSAGEITDLPLEQWDESYTLHIPVGGNAKLTAPTAIGLLRGLQTFSQLVYTHLSTSTQYIQDAPIEIKDKPAFAYRGLLLDTSRHFFPVKDLKRTLDAMSWSKLNTFHWHITDSQSWPLFVPDFPEISEKGAYSAKEVYSTEDLKEVIEYGKGLGITTMVEVDIPGHTDSIVHSHPEYVACSSKSPAATYSNEPPAGQIRFYEPKVTDFVNQIINSVLPDISGSYWSTGGDELNLPCYTSDPSVNKSLSSQSLSLESALTRFVLSTHSTVRSHKKIPTVWEEMALDHDVGTQLGNDTVVIVWISSANARAVADQGYKIVHAPSDYFYLDCGGGGWEGSNVEGNSWCDPYKTWQKVYDFDPFNNLTSSQRHLVLGGQTALWTEQSDPNNLDSIVWPRAAAAAEVFWTGSKLPSGDERNVTEALPRLHDWRYRTVSRGVKAIALQPHWCAVRPHACDLGS